MKINVYTAKGVKKIAENMPKSIMQEVNLPLLAQAQRVYENRKHPGLSFVKTRADVKISKRKIYRQKGTGGARHGAKSAPIFVGGGIAHGPKGIKKGLNLPKKMKQIVLKSSLTLKASEGKLIVVDGIANINKTKEVDTLINKIKGVEKFSGSKYTFVLSKKNSEKIKYFRNINNMSVISGKNLNSYNTYLGGLVLMDKEAIDELSGHQRSSSTLVKSEQIIKDTSKNKAKKILNQPENVVSNKKKVK